MSQQHPFAEEVARYIELLRERGPLTSWEIAAIVETESFRIQDRLAPVVEEGMVVDFQSEGRTFYRLPDQQLGASKNEKPFFDKVASALNRRLSFEPIPKRTAAKRAMVESCSYKKLITEAYVLTRDSRRYSEDERIKTNLIVERDLKKLKTLDEKKLYLADFIYEKALGREKSYFKKRSLFGE